MSSTVSTTPVTISGKDGRAVTLLLRPGDVLLYSGTGRISRIIQRKTWSQISHCEVFDGRLEGTLVSLASRDGLGVNRYTFRTTGLVAVLRPPVYNVLNARLWFGTVQGQPYGWTTLLNFLGVEGRYEQLAQQICSQFLVNLLRAGGLEPFWPFVRAVDISPRDLPLSQVLPCLWSDIDELQALPSSAA